MKKKAYLELAITLVIGFLIGFFVNSIVTDKRIKEYSMHQGEWNFWRRALTEIDATPKQKQTIAPIIKEYTDDARDIMHASWKEIIPLMEEMDKAIMNELTPVQQKRINEIKEKRSKMRRDNINEKNGQYGKRQRQGDGPRQGPERMSDKQSYKHKNNGLRQEQHPDSPPPPPTPEE